MKISYRSMLVALASISLMVSFLNPALANTGQDWSADLAFYRQEVFEPDNSYSEDERAQAESLLSLLEAGHASMSNAGVELALARISALANNGHSFLMPGGWTQRYNRLPLSFHIFSDGVFIIDAAPEFSSLVGSELVAVDESPVEQIMEAWSGYQAGQPGWQALYLPYFLEAPELLHAAGLASHAGNVELSLRDDTGGIRKVDVPAQPDLPALEGIDLYLAPSRLLVHSMNAPAESLPVYLQEPSTAFRFRILEQPAARYIQFKANIDYSGQQDIDAFVDSVAGELRRSPPGHIILDQRFNYGGDLNITRELMQRLPEHLGSSGKLFLVTSGQTFSAGISSIGYAKQAAGERAVIVGEPVGDALEFWAEGDLKVLPNSGVAFLMATERHNYVTGCQESDCHGSIRRNPIRVDSLDPDIPAPLSHAAFQKGVDPALDAISQLIQAGGE